MCVYEKKIKLALVTQYANNRYKNHSTKFIKVNICKDQARKWNSQETKENGENIWLKGTIIEKMTKPWWKEKCWSMHNFKLQWTWLTIKSRASENVMTNRQLEVGTLQCDWLIKIKEIWIRGPNPAPRSQ